ncbi:MAG: transporter [Pseudomonadota bacterium]|nr:transporter [Pseudomonadota bacterium]
MLSKVFSRLSVAALAGGALFVSFPALAAEDGDIITDRPDFVESSKVVGIGRFQIETSVAAEQDRDVGVRRRSYSTPTLLRYGISDTLELRVETDGRMIEQTTLQHRGARSTAAGYADTALGVKWHVVDDAPGVPSMAVLLHADLASGSEIFRGEGVRPSLRVAAEWDLPAGMALGVMPGIGIERAVGAGRYSYGVLGVVLGKEITPTVRAFIEIAAPKIARARDGGTAATFDTGAGWLLAERCQLDAMASFGLNRRTPDLALTIGFSYKL